MNTNKCMECGREAVPAIAAARPLLDFSGFSLQDFFPQLFARTFFFDGILARGQTVCVNTQTVTPDPLAGLAALLDERNLSPAARPYYLRWAKLWYLTVDSAARKPARRSSDFRVMNSDFRMDHEDFPTA